MQPVRRTKLMIRRRVAVTILAAMLVAGIASAQVGAGGYQGPAVLSRGAQGVGNRAGQQVNLRYSIGVNGIYDTGLVPFALGADGKLQDLGGQPGVEASATAYGSHEWRRSLLGLDYSGNYRRYPKSDLFSGSNQILKLGYTLQPTRRFTLDTTASAGTTKFGSGFANYGGGDTFDPNTALLFDNRLNFAQGGLHASYLTSARTSYTAGGQFFTVRRDNAQFASVNGYSLEGTAQHQLSRRTIVGALFTHMHYDYSKSFGESDINSYLGFWQRTFGRSWKASVKAGIFTAEVQGLERINLDPEIAQILGVSTGVRTFYRKTNYPSGEFTLSWLGRTSTFTTSYQRTFNPGNGIYLTSTAENALLSYSYSGVRKWTLSLSAFGNRMKSVGQDLQPYRSLGGAVGATRAITDSLHVVARFDSRQQQISGSSFRRWSNRYSLGIAFSPGSIPLSLW
jgi:hypothetical protein